MNQKFIDDQIEVQKELHAQVNKLQADVDFWQKVAKSATKSVIKLQAEVERLKSIVSYKQIGFVHLKRWRAGNAPEHCFSTEKEQYDDVAIYVEEQNHD